MTRRPYAASGHHREAIAMNRRPLIPLVAACLSLHAVRAVAQDPGWGRLGGYRGSTVIVTRTDGAEVRGRVLNLAGDSLAVGGEGRLATVLRPDIVAVTRVRKSWWWAWGLGGLLGGAALSCATTDYFADCMNYGVYDEDLGRVMAIRYAVLGAAIAASAVMGNDRTVYQVGTAPRVGVSLLPANMGRIALTLSLHH